MGTDSEALHTPLAYRVGDDDPGLLHLSTTSEELLGVWVRTATGLDSYYPAGRDCRERLEASRALDGDAGASWGSRVEHLLEVGSGGGCWQVGPVPEPSEDARALFARVLGVRVGVGLAAPQLSTVTGVGVCGPQAAKSARDRFKPAARVLARWALDGAPPRSFRPAPMTEFASWFTDLAGTVLVVVVAPAQMMGSLDTVFSHAIAWQQDRDLLFVVPVATAAGFLDRLAWIQTSCRVLGYDDGLRLRPEPVPARDLVWARWSAALPVGNIKPHVIPADLLAWVSRLLQHSAITGTSMVSKVGYVSWKHEGLQVLRLGSSQGILRVAAGVQHSNPHTLRPETPPRLKEEIGGPLTDAQLQVAVAAIESDRARVGALNMDPAEHRLQSALENACPPVLGLTTLRAEFPGWRGPGRKGFIDFLGIDAEDHLHVVETKVGSDPGVLIQALDYAIWVQAQQAVIRQGMGWAAAPAQTAVHLDLVLAAKVSLKGKVSSPAVGPYLAAQMEALAGDVRCRVFIVTDPRAAILELREIRRRDLWSPVPGSVSKPVTSQRWTGRVENGLRNKIPTQRRL